MIHLRSVFSCSVGSCSSFDSCSELSCIPYLIWMAYRSMFLVLVDSWCGSEQDGLMNERAFALGVWSRHVVFFSLAPFSAAKRIRLEGMAETANIGQDTL